MNRLFYILLATLITCPAAQAIDLKTEASCKKLVRAISQAQNIEKLTTAWQTISASATITPEDRTAIVDQALQLAKEQKTALEQELNALGNETKNYSKLKWGAGQLAAGTWLALAEIYVLIALSSTEKELENVPGSEFVWPELWIKHKGWITKDFAGLLGGLRMATINPIIGCYCFYKAYHNLKQGLNYKKFLQDKITNLDAIITHLQEVERTN